MIDKNVVKNIVDEWLEGQDYFLVGIEISQDDKIVVEIDHADDGQLPTAHDDVAALQWMAIADIRPERFGLDSIRKGMEQYIASF